MEIVQELIQSLDLPSKEKTVQIQNDILQGGVLKIDSDGAVVFGRGVAGAGLVVRNHAGEFAAATCRRDNNNVDPFTIELIACRDAMVFAMEK